MNAVIYARYSSHGQTEQSIEGQLRDCHDFAAREGYIVVKEYIDRALTGRSDDRPAFQDMIKDAASRQFQYVLVWKLDRFARNRYDSAMYKARLKKHGVRVVSATEHISDNPEGILLEGILEAQAEYYSANLAMNVKRGMREAAIKGNFLGGIIPTGYKVENKRLVIDEDKAHIVQYIFQQYAAGVKKRAIIETLNNKGYRTSSGRNFTVNSFYRLLNNRRYIGEYTYGDIVNTDANPALIDKDTFERAQAMLRTNKHAAAAGSGRVEYLLQGKAFCGMCGSRLVGDAGTGRSGERFNYYSCGKRKKHHTCTKTTEKKGFLEWYVVEQTCLYVLAPERLKYIADEVVATYYKEFDRSKIDVLHKRIEKIDRDIEKTVDASIDAPKGKRQKYFDRMDLLDAQKADAEAELAALQIASKAQLTSKEMQKWLKSFCEGDPLDEDYQRRIIDLFVNTVYVYDDKIVIYYNVRGGQQVSYMEMLDSVDSATVDDGGGGCSNSKRKSPPPKCQAPARNYFLAGALALVMLTFGLIAMVDLWAFVF